MSENSLEKSIEELMSLSKEDLDMIYSHMDLMQIEAILGLLNEVSK